MKPLPRLLALAVALGLVVALWRATDRRESVLGQMWGLNQEHGAELREKLKARPAPQIDGRLAFSRDDVAGPVRAEPDGGRYDGPVRVALEATEGEWIHYTLDGSIPTRRSPRYDGPVEIESTAVLRFRAFARGRFPGDTVTRTYFVRENGALPRVSLVADPVTLWNKYSGIYRHPEGRGRVWERDAHLEYFPRGGGGLRLPFRLRIHGTASRFMRKKPLRVIYDVGDIAGDATSPLLSAGAGPRTVILRQGGSNVRYRLHDELFGAIYAGLGGLASAHEPVVVHINGEYWGLHNLRERIDEDFLLRRVGPGSYDLVGRDGLQEKVHWRLRLGDWEAFERTQRFLRDRDLRSDRGLRAAAALVDLEACTDYWLLNIFAANNDWPHYNLYLYRHREGRDRRWRPISWDADQAFIPGEDQLGHDTLTWATRDRVMHRLRENWQVGMRDLPEFVETTLWLRTLLENDAYRLGFITRMCDLLNHDLRPDRTLPVLERLVAAVEDEVARDCARWELPLEDYRRHVEGIRLFFRARPARVREFFRRKFALGGSLTLEVGREGGGVVLVNSLPVGPRWTGEYFEGLPVRLTARAEKGWTFAGWSPPELGEGPEVTVPMRAGLRAVALFRR